MGQTNSTAAVQSDASTTSGVTLAPELEADIIRDFQSKLLQEEWNKFGTKIVQRRNERYQKLQDANAAQQQQRQLQSIGHSQRMQSLDADIDTMNATFVDQTTAMEYDATQLMAKYNSHGIPIAIDRERIDDIEKDSKPLPCLGQRAHWMDCQTKYAADSRPCNFYVTALEECVTQTIGQSVILAAASATATTGPKE